MHDLGDEVTFRWARSYLAISLEQLIYGGLDFDLRFNILIHIESGLGEGLKGIKRVLDVEPG